LRRVAGPTVSFVTTPGGRRLAWSELGDPSGTPVLWCHGGLSSRTDAHLVPGAALTGVRLVTVDRPGLGESDRAKQRTVADWASDARTVVDALGIDRFDVVGWSAGGPFALAVAAAMPERVRAVATIGGMAPVRDRADRKELGLRADRLLIPMSRHAAWLARLVLRASMLGGAERAKKMLLRPFSEADRRVLAPMPTEVVTGGTRDASAHGVAGLVDDYRAFGAPDWGFDLAEVKAPVAVWQGEADAALPVTIGRRLAAALPRAELCLVPDAGHFLIVEHGASVLERLRSDG
jgi:pimeloyl-ACP methyl ester carboxylesterase